MTAETEFLDDGLVPGKQRAKHETNLKCRIDTDAPHF